MKVLGGQPRLQGFIFRRFRIIILLFVACSIFSLLQNAFGSVHYLSLVPRDKFPKKIWQSWRVDPLRFEERDNERARTWTTKNPGHRYEVLTDANAMAYVEQYFGPSGFNRPDIVHTYKALNAKIIRADLLRYLVMYVEGGVYTDIDVEALRSIDHFIPHRYDERDIDMVIGIEIDEPKFQSHPVLGKKSQSFCQWTFMCKPRLPVMMRLIENILKWLNELSQKQNKPISEIVLDFDEVISGTGPSAFTSAVLAEMSAMRGEATTWETFHDLVESKVVGRVLVLTVEAFAAGTGHSDSGNHGGKRALVKHHFHASSWPTNHPRFKHPIYGEVEKCNWNVECIQLWDTNTAIFDSLPEQEQLKMIAIREIDEQVRMNAIVPQARMDAVRPPVEIPLGLDLPPPAEIPLAALPVEAPPAEEIAPPAENVAPHAEDIVLAGIPEGLAEGLPEGLPEWLPEKPPADAPPV